MSYDNYQPGDMPLPWPLKSKRADFDRALLEDLLWTRGVDVLWQQAARCPCGDEQAASPTCSACGGLGWVFFAQQVTRAAIIGVRATFDPFKRAAFPFAPGEAMITVRGEHSPAPYDRITLLQGVTRMSKLLERKAAVGAVEVLGYPVVEETIDLIDEDGVITATDQSVFYLQASTPAGDGTGRMVAGPVLTLGTDFEVTDDGDIDWALGEPTTGTGKAPAPGSQFSIYYNTRPVFRVIGYTHALRETTTKRKTTSETPETLPVQATMKLEWMVDLPRA